jgi:signal transduction histidine kinase
MDWLTSIARWFSGGAVQYRTLFHCMEKDMLWIGITVLMDVAVASGYVIIALHWRRNQRQLRNARAEQAMGRMKNIFFLCGLCGYVFIPVKMIWPAWRLYDFFMAALAYVTWRYALDTRNLNVVYNELNRSNELAADLAVSQEESRRKSFFLNAVSHDLRTPVNGMVLQCDYAAMSLDAGDAEGARRALAAAHESARSTASLLDSFLELARLDWKQDSAQIATFTVTDTLRSVTASFRHQAEAKGVALVLEPCDRPIVIRSDRLKIQRILANLVGNAVKFTPAGSVRVGLSTFGRDVRIDVVDSGVGITPDDQARIFQEFFQVQNQARDRRKGFGLGLTIAARLTELLGGKLSVESTAGRGSRFSLFLPEVVEVSAVGANGATESGGASDGREQTATTAIVAG